MYIMDAQQKNILNADFVERYVIAEKDDAVLISASLGADRGVTLGRYNTLGEAQDILYRLYCALANNEPFFDMPQREHKEPVKKDARITRKGGS
jgi:hypothetical protein